jgi:hypothetical protein
MPIPEINIHYKVRYHIEGYEKEFETPAYPTYEVASEQRNDIAGYEGVYDVYLVPVHDDTAEMSDLLIEDETTETEV